MNLLLLRGQVPTDRPPSEIVFDNMDELDDVWTQLVYNMTGIEDYTEVWYWGGNREKKFSNNFTERWLSSFNNYKSTFEPNVIFCRGGFQEYHIVLNKFPKAFKIYYGAGARFIPPKEYTDYDLVLMDSPYQVEECNKKYPNLRAELFIKPAPDNIFKPKDEEKIYDICFLASGHTKRKGHAFVYKTVPKKYSVLNLGLPCTFVTKPDNVTSYKVQKTELPTHISKCKIGIVTSTINSGGGLDSCPRVLPEMLACGLPIVVLDETLFWSDMYISTLYYSSMSYASGIVSNRADFWNNVDFMLKTLDLYSPREYYNNNLSLSIAAKYLKDLICV